MTPQLPLKTFLFAALNAAIEEIFLSQDGDGNTVQVMSSDGQLGVSVHGDQVALLNLEDATVLHAVLGEWIASHRTA